MRIASMISAIVIVILVILIVAICYLTRFRSMNIFQSKYDDAWFPIQYHEEYYVDNCHTWFFDNNSDRIILYCHGNYGNMSYYSHVPYIARRLGISLLMFDYRGFGQSLGRATTDTIKEDGLTMYSHLINDCNYKEEDIIVWGESLGGSIAAWIASNNRPGKVVLLSTFSNIHDVIRYHSNGSVLIHGIISIADILYDSLPIDKWIQDIKSPICLIHSKHDTYIPYSCSITNSKLNRDYIHEYITITGDHTTPILGEEDVKRLSSFLDANVCYTDLINDFNYVYANSSLTQ